MEDEQNERLRHTDGDSDVSGDGRSAVDGAQTTDRRLSDAEDEQSSDDDAHKQSKRPAVNGELVKDTDAGLVKDTDAGQPPVSAELNHADDAGVTNTYDDAVHTATTSANVDHPVTTSEDPDHMVTTSEDPDHMVTKSEVRFTGDERPPLDPSEYQTEVREDVQQQQIKGEEADSAGEEYETLTTITRTTRKTTYHERPVLKKTPQRRPADMAPAPESFFHTQDMAANKKLYGKDLSEYENMDMDELLDQLSPEEVDLLTRDVDPDDTLMPPCQRMSYRCEKAPTGPLDRKKLIEHIHQQALNDPDRPEMVPYLPGTVRGKKWIPPPPPVAEQRLEEEIQLDLGDEYESALGDASENELVDLAAILGFHSMMNQDQYHASLVGKRLESEVGWAGITRATRPKPMAPEPPNDTDPEESIERLREDDAELLQLNLNNIKTMSDEQLARLCEAAAANTRLESLLMSNTGLGDRHAQHFVTMLEKNNTIKEISLESNFISPLMIARLVRALNKNNSVEALRAANQRSQVLGNKIEMEITKDVEQNSTILQLGLHFEFNDARARVSAQLQKNRDRSRRTRQTEGVCCSFSLALPASQALALPSHRPFEEGDTSEDEPDEWPEPRDGGGGGPDTCD